MKIEVIHQNAHQYSVSAMCKVLKIPRSTYYDSIKRTPNKLKNDDSELENIIIDTCLIRIEKALAQDELKMS